MGKLRVYCLKTLNKLSIYPLGKTPSAPSVLHLVLLLLQPISLGSNHGSVQFTWNEGWRLTLVLSPVSKPQSLPTSTAEYLMDRVNPFQGLSTTSASITPRRSNVHIIASLGPCSEPCSDSKTRSITKAWCQSWSSSVAPATQWWYQLSRISARSTHYKSPCQINQTKSVQDFTCWFDR